MLHTAGRVDISTSNSEGISGGIAITSGEAKNGASGAILLSTSSATTGKAGSNIQLSIGSGDSNGGGDISIEAGHTSDGLRGPIASLEEIKLVGGNSDLFKGGQVILKTGTGKGTSSGSLYFETPNSGNSGRSGNVSLTTGISKLGSSGHIELVTGDSTGDGGGPVNIKVGQGSNTAGEIRNPGNVSMSAGNFKGMKLSRYGGSIVLQAGAGTDTNGGGGGLVKIASGEGSGRWVATLHSLVGSGKGCFWWCGNQRYRYVKISNGGDILLYGGEKVKRQVKLGVL